MVIGNAVDIIIMKVMKIILDINMYLSNTNLNLSVAKNSESHDDTLR